MKKLSSLLAIAILGCLAMPLAGCSGGADSASDAPTKAEIDKGLQGQPEIEKTPIPKAPTGVSMKGALKGAGAAPPLGK